MADATATSQPQQQQQVTNYPASPNAIFDASTATYTQPSIKIIGIQTLSNTSVLVSANPGAMPATTTAATATSASASASASTSSLTATVPSSQILARGRPSITPFSAQHAAATAAAAAAPSFVSTLVSKIAGAFHPSDAGTLVCFIPISQIKRDVYTVSDGGYTRQALLDVIISGSTGESEHKYGVSVYMANSIDEYASRQAQRLNAEPRHSFGASDGPQYDGELELGKASPKSLLRGIPISGEWFDLEGLPPNLTSFVFPHVQQTPAAIVGHLDNGISASNGSKIVPLVPFGTTTVNPIAQQIYMDLATQPILGVTVMDNGNQFNVPETTFNGYRARVLQAAIAANRALTGGILIELVPWTEAKLPHYTRRDAHIPTLTVEVQLTNFRVYAPSPPVPSAAAAQQQQQQLQQQQGPYRPLQPVYASTYYQPGYAQ